MKNLILHNYILKILSFFIAILIWVYVLLISNPVIEKVFPVNLEYQNLNPSYTVVTSTNKINLKVKGASNYIKKVKNEDIHAIVNLKGMKEGTFIKKVEIVTPQFVEAVNKNISVPLKLISYEEKIFPIEIKIQGNPIKGYKLGTPNISPKVIKVYAPKDRIQNVKSIKGNLFVRNQKENILTTIPLKAYDASGAEIKDVTLQPDSVKVWLPIENEIKSKYVVVAPSILGNPAENYYLKSIKIKPSSIKIWGEDTFINGIESIKTDKISIYGIHNNLSKEVHLEIPNGINTEIKKVKVEIEVKKLEEIYKESTD